MIVYRIARSKYANKLISSGAANRWNLQGQRLIYTSENVSLCALELLAHTGGIQPAGKYSIMKIAIEGNYKPHEVQTNDLPDQWHLLKYYPMTQALGSQ